MMEQKITSYELKTDKSSAYQKKCRLTNNRRTNKKHTRNKKTK